MKRRLAAILMTLLVTLGCGNLTNVDPNTRVSVDIWRDVRLDEDPHLYIRADNAHAEGRLLIVEGTFSISGTNGRFNRWVVKSMFIQDGKLIIDIDDPQVHFNIYKK